MRKQILFALAALAVAGLYVMVTGDAHGALKAMAVVTGPLMSLTASGTFGDSITFDKRGFARIRVIPANPKSDEQGNVRQMLLAVQKALTKLGETPITAVKTVAPISYRWNSYLLSQVIGAASSEFDASMAAFAALTAPQRADWDTRATTAGILTQTIEYATDAAISGGAALFAVSRTLFGLGFNVVDGAPAAGNFDDWGDYFVS